MEIISPILGRVLFGTDDILTFPKGMIGFEHLTKCLLAPYKGGEHIRCLIPVEHPEMLFSLVDPRVFDPDYHVEVDPREVGEINISDLKKVEVYVTARMVGDVLILNLKGPVAINTEAKLGKQLALSKSPYSVSHVVKQNGAAV